jgi:hypothetical protein
MTVGLSAVIAGLDPAIHLKTSFFKERHSVNLSEDVDACQRGQVYAVCDCHSRA